MFRLSCCVLVVCMSVSAYGQVLFPGNALERRSRTYDVLHYKIVVAFDEKSRSVEGTTFITLVPLVAVMDSLELDAEEMKIASVAFSRGKPARFANRSPKLVVFFDTPQRPADTITVAVQYSCTPQAGLYFVQPDSTNPSRRSQIWTQGEDTDNHFWFPCYDYPNDKATSEVIATVPESYTLLSNGKLVSTAHDAKNRTKTFHWFESKPHSSYLIMITAGVYEVVREHHGSVPLEYYVYKDRVKDGVRSLSKTGAVMKFYEERIGLPYPWEKYAQVWISNFMWGGMENTSAVTLNDDAYLLDSRAAVDFSSDDVVAHELAHQWWGDLVTSRDWNHLWLHEGFANYFEALFKQNQKGDEYFQYDLLGEAAGVISAEDMHGRKPLAGKDGFTANVYSKGCWVLHMLRHELGEQAFWVALRSFVQRYAHKNVDSHEFMLAIEDATGRNLGWFFEQWVYKAGHPKVSVETQWDDDARQLHVTLRQTQAVDSMTGVFRFPLTIECTTPAGRSTRSVFVDDTTEHVMFSLPERPLMVIVDNGKHVLGTFEVQRSTTELIHVLKHATDVGERLMAAKRLQGSNNEDPTFEALRSAALYDRFWAVRNEALLALASSDQEAVKQTLVDAHNDKHSSVRATAIASLSRFRSTDVADVVANAAVRDSSLLVASACLKTLSDVDSLRGVDLALRNVVVDSYRHILRRASMDVLARFRDVRSIPFALTYSGIAHPPDIRRQAVRILGRAGRGNPDAGARLQELLSDGVSAIRKETIEGLASSGGAQVKALLEKAMNGEKDESVKKALEQALDNLPFIPDPGEE